MKGNNTVKGYDTERIFRTYAEQMAYAKENKFDLEKLFHEPRGNNKTGKIPGWALLPGVTCSGTACKNCFVDGCYAVKNVLCHGYDIEKNNCLKAWAENTVLVSLYVETFEKKMRECLTRKHPAFFRIHTSGDFLSVAYAQAWYRIAKDFPDTRFLAFTKKWDVIRKVPFHEINNFSLVLSGWTNVVIPEDLRNLYPCAWCNDGKETRIPKDALHCPGNCDSCGLCWELKNINKDTYFDKH